ncbi:hypothetical protein cpu_25550 [Carboxydothermus pertinax]|uniref:Uncharacterized protein n=2 Tax=Carboxydothermus pertinax TaxID=870242 RepID=A0A1L8CYP5_9THEO|nr:hypothetical protein cpu_25550 [Carboxydothermus pertinax]
MGQFKSAIDTKVHTIALNGINGEIVEVEVDINRLHLFRGTIFGRSGQGGGWSPTFSISGQGICAESGGAIQ